MVLLDCFLLCFLSSSSSTAWRKRMKAATIWARNPFTRKLPPPRSTHEHKHTLANSNMNSELSTHTVPLKHSLAPSLCPAWETANQHLKWNHDYSDCIFEFNFIRREGALLQPALYKSRHFPFCFWFPIVLLKVNSHCVPFLYFPVL